MMSRQTMALAISLVFAFGCRGGGTNECDAICGSESCTLVRNPPGGGSCEDLCADALDRAADDSGACADAVEDLFDCSSTEKNDSDDGCDSMGRFFEEFESTPCDDETEDVRTLCSDDFFGV